MQHSTTSLQTPNPASYQRKYQEKRDFIRMQMNAQATLALSSGEHISLTCVDLSSSGVQLRSQQPLSVDTTAELTIDSANNLVPPLKAQIRLCRVRADGDSYLIGASIEQLQ